MAIPSTLEPERTQAQSKLYRLPFSGLELVLIGLALIVGALLRLVGNDQPFPTSDHAEVAAIATFFYPRSPESLLPSSTSTWNILTGAHGVLSPLIGMVAGTLYGLLGIKITEFWWNFPFVLIHLLSIPLAALLARRLAGPAAGVSAALLVALLPIHASLSRASGVGHTPLNFFFQLITLLSFLRYIEAPSSRRALLAGGALAANMLVDQLFPLLFVLVYGVGVLALPAPPRALWQRLGRARELVFAPRVMVLPLVVLCLILVLLTLYGMGWTSSGGIATRLFAGSDRQPGIYLGAFVDNARYVAGTLALLVLCGLGLVRVPALLRLEARGVTLFWALLYLLPFLVFTRPHVYELFMLGLAPLTVNAATVIGTWLHQGRWLPRVAGTVVLVLLVGLFGLRSLSMIFGIQVVGFVESGRVVGALYDDQGLKAAGWWVRTHTGSDERVFADNAFEPYQLWYYLRRPFLGLTDAEQPEEVYRLLEDAEPLPSVYLVRPENEPLLRQYAPEQPHLLARVLVHEQPVLLIFGQGVPPDEVEMLEAEVANRQFDAQFGMWQAMFHVGRE